MFRKTSRRQIAERNAANFPANNIGRNSASRLRNGMNESARGSRRAPALRGSDGGNCNAPAEENNEAPAEEDREAPAIAT